MHGKNMLKDNATHRDPNTTWGVISPSKLTLGEDVEGNHVGGASGF